MDAYLSDFLSSDRLQQNPYFDDYGLPKPNEAPMPHSAAQSIFTPGLTPGTSMADTQSWFNTPINTPVTPPYGPAHPALSIQTSWPIPSSILPQSAPAHISSFPSDFPTPSLPNLPLTPPARFAQTQQQVQMMSSNAGSQMMRVVPSQPGLLESPNFLASQQSHLLRAEQAANWASPTSWPSFSNDAYGEHALWMFQNTYVPQKEIEVKLDAGCQRLADEVKDGKAQLVPIRPQEFSFQNTTTRDMKKVLEEKE